MSNERRWTQPIGLTLVWLLTALLAIAVGVVAVLTVGAGLRDRGPIGTEVDLPAVQGASAEPDTSLPLVEKTIREEFGEFDVACRGAYALGLEVRPDTANGWAVVGFEEGPDDDVDAVFANRGRSIEIEVYCNRGEPTVGDLEINTLPDD